MLGERIRSRRKALNVRQVDLAESVGVKAQALWRIEAGKVDSPGVRLIEKIAKHLGCTVDDLLGEGDAVEPEAPPPVEPVIEYDEPACNAKGAA